MTLINTPGKKLAVQAFFTAVMYGVLFFLLQLFLWKITMLPAFPTDKTLGMWDANLYHSIAEGGYVYHADAVSNTGFFILFPWIWKLSCLGAWGISFLNLIFFAIGFAIIVFITKVSFNTQLLWLTTPSIFYMFIPYTEALFFLLVSLSFYGIVYNKKLLIFVSLFLIAMTRSVSIVLIPSFFIMFLLTSKDWYKWRNISEYILLYLLPLVAGLAFFCWYQYSVTGVWFDYFAQQSKYLGHVFAIPILPFSNLNGLRILWFNSLALFTALVAGFSCIKMLFQWIRKKSIVYDRLLVVSCMYMIMIAFINVMFNPVWGSGTTNLISTHRYIFATPFFFIFLNYFTQSVDYKLRHFIIIFIMANVVWLCSASYTHIQTFLFFNVNTAIVFFYMLNARKVSWVFFTIIVLNIFVQVGFLQQFIGGILPE